MASILWPLVVAGLISATKSPASEVVAWGRNDYGQTSVPTGLRNVAAIAAGYFASLALTGEGWVVGWGHNGFGQTSIPSGLSNVVAIAEGNSHCLALATDGRVVAWGASGGGQTRIPGDLSNVVAIAAGHSHSMALTSGGRVVSWGYNGYGRTNVPSGLSNAVAIAAGYSHSLALTSGGRVVSWGYNGYGLTNVPSSLSNAVAIAAGYSHSLALKTDGKVVGWGGNGQNQTSIPSGLSNVVAIAAGLDHSLALTTDGNVVAWGLNNYGQTSIPGGLSNVVAIAAGYYHSLAIKGNGAPVIVGQPNSQLVITGGTTALQVLAVGTGPLAYQWRRGGSNLTDGSKVSGAASATLALTDIQLSELGDYTAVITNSFGSTASVVAHLRLGQAITFDDALEKKEFEVPFALTATASSGLPVSYSSDNPTVATISGVTVSICGHGNARITATQSGDAIYGAAAPVTRTLLVSSEVVGWPDGSAAAAVPNGLHHVVAVAAGLNHSLALAADGLVIAWGLNDYNQTNIPTGLSNVAAISAGRFHSLALTADGKVVGWGYNYYGQTSPPSTLSNVVAITAGGDGSLALTAEGRVVGWGNTPVGQAYISISLSNAIAISAGWGHSLALTADDGIIGWGDSATIPSGLSNVVAISAGASHSLALTADGRVIAWGDNYAAQCSIPNDWTNVVAIAGGVYHSLALTADGKVASTWGWGGQTNIPSGLNSVVAIAAGDGSLAITSDHAPSVAGPSSQTAIAGMAVVFNIGAAGTLPLKYQWRRDGTELCGQTNSTLFFKGVTPALCGDYAVEVVSASGKASTSSVAGLTVNCTLVATTASGGTISRIPDLPIYPGNSFASLTATAHEGYGFIRWAGDADGSTNPLQVILDTNKNIEAVFASTAITVVTQGIGLVLKAPDREYYSVDEEVILSAEPGRWYGFADWGDGGTNNPRVITIGENNRYTAVFTPTTALETVTIGGVIRQAPVGMPAVQVAGKFIVAESVSSRGSALIKITTTFPSGTLLYTLDGTAPSLASSLYTGQFSVAKTCVVRAIAYKSDFSSAVEADPVTVVILPTLTGTTAGGGSVAIQPPSGAYFSNSIALVTATPSAGWEFLQWLGDAEGTNPTVSLTMTRNKRVTGVFGTSLNTTTTGSGSLIVDPVAARYPYGANVRLTAVPAEGNYFAFWANAGLGKTNNPLIFTVRSANTTVTAAFASLPGDGTNALTVTADGRGQVTVTPPWNRFPLNTNVVLRAFPDAGQVFLGWSGDAVGTTSAVVVTMLSNTVVRANFTKLPRLQGEGYRDLLSEDGFRLTLAGEWNTAYRIDHSTNLMEWTPLTTLTNAFGTVQFTDGEGTNVPTRFYRAVTPP